jgi:hypothetical protein
MDGAFFRQDVLTWLTARGVGYGIRVPFYHWLDLQQYIRAAPTWTRVTPEMSGFVVPAAATPWGPPLWVAIYRKKVAHRTAKTFQLDLFDPNNGSYEYSAITSNLGFTVANLWSFMAGRGNHEKTIAQLKGGLAFHTVPTMAYAANSAWQQIGGPHPQLADELPTRDGRRSTAPLAEAHDLVCARDYSDASVRVLPPSGHAPLPRRTFDPSAGSQRGDGAAVSAHRTCSGSCGLSFCRIRVSPIGG